MIESRDPIERWRDVSARAAGATGYHPAVRGRLQATPGWPIGGLALAVVLVLAGLSLRPAGVAAPDASDPRGTGAEPVVARADDGVFRLELITPRAAYSPMDAIEPVATITYLGSEAAVTVYHAEQSIGFRIEEVDGKRVMGGGMRQPCRSTELISGVPSAVPFSKAGSPDDGFDRAWYEDPVLRLPVGTWRITADLDVYLGIGNGCGAERHRLTVSNEIRVEESAPSPDGSIAPSEASASPPAPSTDASPSPQPTASADPVTGRTDDGLFRLELTTSSDIYALDDVITPVATLAYVGRHPSVAFGHSDPALVFSIMEIGGGGRQMTGGANDVCLSTVLRRDQPMVIPFRKSGQVGLGFDLDWFQDPVLRLPPGTWRIRARLEAYVPECGSGAAIHEPVVEKVIVVR